jgi:hypothetical protein
LLAGQIACLNAISTRHGARSPLAKDPTGEEKEIFLKKKRKECHTHSQSPKIFHSTQKRMRGALIPVEGIIIITIQKEMRSLQGDRAHILILETHRIGVV